MDAVFIKVLLVVLLQCINESFGQVTARIVGGEATTISQVPYLVNLRLDGSFICGGSLIRTNFVLTAAHCVKGVTASRITVQGGSSLLSNNYVIRAASRIFVPSTYNTDTMIWDVAIIKLASPMTGTNIATIPLCSKTLYVGDAARISGWGLTTETGTTAPNEVRTALVYMISKANCAAQYADQVTLESTMICASVPGSVDTCSGDSGGPLVIGGEVCGIVSFGIGCARSAYPGVYTGVNKVLNYINSCLLQ